jgi:hypothetical protein
MCVHECVVVGACVNVCVCVCVCVCAGEGGDLRMATQHENNVPQIKRRNPISFTDPPNRTLRVVFFNHNKKSYKSNINDTSNICFAARDRSIHTSKFISGDVSKYCIASC